MDNRMRRNADYCRCLRCISFWPEMTAVVHGFAGICTQLDALERWPEPSMAILKERAG